MHLCFDHLPRARMHADEKFAGVFRLVTVLPHPQSVLHRTIMHKTACGHCGEARGGLAGDLRSLKIGWLSAVGVGSTIP